MLTDRRACRRAHLLSHSVRNTGIAFAHAPTAPEFTIPQHPFRVCCSWSGWHSRWLSPAWCAMVVKNLSILWSATAQRARAQEGSASEPHPPRRCFREVPRGRGARVKLNACLRDVNVGVRAADERCIEVLTQGLPCFNGVRLAIDITPQRHEQRRTTASTGCR